MIPCKRWRVTRHTRLRLPAEPRRRTDAADAAGQLEQWARYYDSRPWNLENSSHLGQLKTPKFPNAWKIDRMGVFQQGRKDGTDDQSAKGKGMDGDSLS